MLITLIILIMKPLIHVPLLNQASLIFNAIHHIYMYIELNKLHVRALFPAGYAPMIHA